MAAWLVAVMVAVAVVLSAASVRAKECTNIPTQLSSHTVRARLQSTPGAAEWRWRELFHDHLNPTDDAAWMDLVPPPPRGGQQLGAAVGEELDWAMLYRSLKGQQPLLPGAGAAAAAGPFLEEVSLHDVRLDLDGDAAYGRAQRTNLEYLLLLDVDRLVWSFRTQAGLPAPGEPYGGWEGKDVELRGHFVGHYLSAAAKMWASTHNGTLAGRMSAVVDALLECQRAAGTGYLAAFPAEFFDRFEAIQPVWAPYYTIHKIMQGLLDQHVVAGNGRALGMVVAMADYFAGRVANVIRRHSIERHWTSLNEETGGMNDVLYQLYTITNDQRHLVLAHLFDKPCFLGLLAVQADSLSDFHANTHIPVVVGGQMRYEVTGDPLYKEIATFFMDTVNSSHAYATGGTSVSEFWSDPKRLAGALTTETEESCTTYNMLKVSRHLFRWTKEIAYADYYERALINGVLSIQRGRDPGVMIYMLPQGPGRSKAMSYHGWGTQFNSFWCCYGTGIESFSKLGDSIYFEEKGERPALYIIQFIPSTFNWRTAGLTITQKLEPLSSSDHYLQVSLSISAKTNGQFATLNVRMPSWTSLNGAKATLNDKDLELASPGTFLTISKQWNNGDHLLLQLPVHLRTEAIKDDRPEYSSIQAVLFGPFLLAGLTTGDWDAKTDDKILSALGERESFPRSEKLGGTLTEQLAKIEPVLKDLRQRRDERVNEFRALQLQIVRLHAEMSGTIDHGDITAPGVDESDLSLKRLGELKLKLNELQSEKNLRLQKIDGQITSIKEMCNIMSLDLKKELYDVHPSYAECELGRSKPVSISNSTLERLDGKIHALKRETKQRLRKLQDLGSTLIELWNLMGTPVDERRCFDHATSLINVSQNTGMPHGCLAHDLIEKVWIEVKRLTHLKASKMKELVLNKMTELEEIYKSVHMVIDSDAERQELNDHIDSGRADLSELLAGIDDRIAVAKEHALSRKDILEKVEKWTSASEEETWLDEYERDQNRYNAGRGAHKNLKRAEKARVLVNKIPSLMENLTAKIKVWENEKGIPFMYNKVRLLDSLEEYTSTRKEKEDEKRRLREQKKLLEQFGAKPSPMRPLPARKPLGSSNVNIAVGTPTSRSVTTPMSRKGGLSSGKVKEATKTTLGTANFVALPKDCTENSSF